MNSRIRPTLYTLPTVAPQQLIIQTSHGLNRLKRKCRRLEKKAVKTDLPGDWNNFHKVRNQYSALLKSLRVNY